MQRIRRCRGRWWRSSGNLLCRGGGCFLVAGGDPVREAIVHGGERGMYRVWSLEARRNRSIVDRCEALKKRLLGIVPEMQQAVVTGRASGFSDKRKYTKRSSNERHLRRGHMEPRREVDLSRNRSRRTKNMAFTKMRVTILVGNKSRRRRARTPPAPERGGNEETSIFELNTGYYSRSHITFLRLTG